jgi:acyl dehydratase
VTALDGTPLFSQKRSIFARGEAIAAASGDRRRLPLRRSGRPTLRSRFPCCRSRALLYRLCGDRNPLHSDPEFAPAAGSPRPILHGLCTCGMTCKRLWTPFSAGMPVRSAAMGGASPGVVFPGETLHASIWRDDGRPLASVIAPARDNAPVLSGVELVPG